ncbi:MAG: hypothetical protein ACTH43_15635 [Brachybacterium sp.]|uniref:hypothetical protein n=1 Tax=Brachybacterium sp. TaxID=1891286 RepID=UPI003F905EFB
MTMTDRRTLRPTRRQAVLALTSLAALSMTACSGGGDEAEFEDPADEPTADEQADGSDASDGGGQEHPSQEADEAEPAAVIDPADAVDTISYTLPSGDIDGTMTVGLHHLRVRGDTMELLLTFTPEFTEPGAFTLWELHGENHSNVGPALFDRVNLKRYDILRTNGSWDTEGVWNSKQAVHELASGDTQAYWANYAAPVDEIDTVNVGIPAGPEFEDVPIEQGPSDATGEPGAEDGEG